METDCEDIVFLIKHCINLKIHVTDNALEHYGEEEKHVFRKWRKQEKALLYF